jgi:hypothetical protein
MGDPTNATKGATTVHTATITDNDSAPSIIVSDAEIDEFTTPGVVTLTMTGSSINDVSVDYATSNGTATAGADYTATSGTITWTAGQTGAKTFNVSITNDLIDDDAETINITLSNASNGTISDGSGVLTIIDDDTIPTVAWTALAPSVSEGAGTATVTAELSFATIDDVTVPYEVTGTATGGAVDYLITTSPIVIEAGETTGSATITLTDDALDEGDETVIVTMGTPVNATQGVIIVHTATITDNDDSPTVIFTSAAQGATEGDSPLTITAQISAVSGRNVTVPYTMTGSTATGGGVDYNITASPITITAGSLSGTTTVTLTDDALDEDDETVIVTMGDPTNATKGAVTVHTVTIVDNDATPTVTFTAESQGATEGDSPLTITAQISAVSGRNVAVPFTMTGSTATGGGTDYLITASPITITAGGTTANITVTITDDVIKEPSETVIVTMGSPTNATQGATTVHTVTITDNDAIPSVTFTAATQSVSEGSGTATVTAQLSAAADLDVTVPFTVTGTATETSDYTITTPHSITITAGSDSANITVTLTDDSLDEVDETVIITMGELTNALPGDITAHTATITDNDDAPTVTFTSAAQGATEGGIPLIITAQISAASSKTITVPYTMTGSTATGGGVDYSITASPITLTPGSTTADITVTIIDDALDEDDETVVVTMGSPTNATQGATTVHTATIADNDATPTVTFTAVSQGATEGDSPLTITAQISAVSGRNVTVPFTLSGTATETSDYTITTTPITITAGNTTANITVILVDNGVKEPVETVVVTMGTPTNATQGATTVHTVTLTDDDLIPSVSWTALLQPVGEGAGTATVTAELSATADLDVTVPFTLSGTATNGVDYTVTTSPITITAGSLSGVVTVTLVEDLSYENDETVIVTMGEPTNATQGAIVVHTATITDNDTAPTVSFTSTSQGVTEDGGPLTVTAQLSVISGKDVTVPFSLSGTATGGAVDYSITASPIIITAGNLSSTATVTIIDDALDEDSETAIVTMGDPTNATKGETTVYTATITDNDSAPTVQFTSSTQSGTEGDSPLTVTAQLSGLSGKSITVPFTVTGTATSVVDYSITASPITITAGSLTGTTTVTITDDSIREPSETVIVTMGTPTNATAGATTVDTVTIVDNDVLPSVTWTQSTLLVGEGDGTAIVTAQLSASVDLDVTVPFTVTGTATSGGVDYSITATPVTITAGSTTGNITITINDDVIDEDAETIIVTMGTPVNASSGDILEETVTLNDNEATPTVSWTVLTQAPNESAGSSTTVKAQISTYSAYDVTVPYTLSGTATGGTDYSIPASPLIIPAGSLLAQVTVTIVDDALDETDETIIVTMGTPINADPGATVVQTITIADNDSTPVVSWSAATQAVNESVGTITLTANLSAASGKNITLPIAFTGTATSGGVDYTASAASISILAGGGSGTVTVTIVNDVLMEGDETIVATIGEPTNATLGATYVHTITLSDYYITPTATTVTGAEATDGTGNVTVSFVADDANDDDTVQALIEYNVDDTWNKATLLDTGVTSTYGAPDIDNAGTYQVGNAGGYIITSSGANTITVVWDAETDLTGTDIADAKVRVTPYDGRSAGTAAESANFELDLADPSGGLTDFATSTINSTDVTFTWTAVSVESNFSKYELYYKVSGGAEYSLYTNIASMGTSSASIMSLTADTVYNVYLKALDEYGHFAVTPTLVVTTAAASTGDEITDSVMIGGGGGSSHHHKKDKDEYPEVDESVKDFEDKWEDEGLKGHWSEPYLKDFFSETILNQILNGSYATGSEMEVLSYFLNPNRLVTRVEFLASAMDLMDIVPGDTGEGTPFKDVSTGVEGGAYIKTAYDMGIVIGYPDGMFKPNQVINRIEALKIALMLSSQNVPMLFGDKLLSYYSFGESAFADVDPNEWYAPYVLYAYRNEVVSGYGDKTFKPANIISLGETAKIIILVSLL